MHLTIRVLNAKRRLEFPNELNVHDKTVSNAIDGLAFTLKTSTNSPQDKNSAERKSCEKSISSAERKNAMKISIDEFGCKIYRREIFGRSKKGKRVIIEKSRLKAGGT